jgi:hypothetical protein
MSNIINNAKTNYRSTVLTVSSAFRQKEFVLTFAHFTLKLSSYAKNLSVGRTFIIAACSTKLVRKCYVSYFLSF